MQDEIATITPDTHLQVGSPLFEGLDQIDLTGPGALLLGAAGLLHGRRATTHWSALDVLPLFGADAVDQRVVSDGQIVFAAGVTAGIDAALTVAARLRGVEVTTQLGKAHDQADRTPHVPISAAERRS